uniref:Gnk2-homologous domain-containing protein n=1 Tax=Ananas comosus var. bracteatus TaxID=296719 RepID=A0A6V7Q708_ANACO|nr:unnamed protein product [Ananas comosus var. bracteatus]
MSASPARLVFFWTEAGHKGSHDDGAAQYAGSHLPPPPAVPPPPSLLDGGGGGRQLGLFLGVRRLLGGDVPCGVGRPARPGLPPLVPRQLRRPLPLLVLHLLLRVGALPVRRRPPLPSCAACVRAAIQRLSSLCPSAAAAAAQLRPCLLRYSNDSSFLGRPDTSLAFRRCGPPSPSSAAADRQAALSALSAPPGAPFRSAAAGAVRGAAQCAGDIGAAQCGDCVAEAVARLTAECGGAGAASGDVYLGKCYARFWPAGEEGAQPSSCAHRRRTRSADLWALFSLVVVVVVVAVSKA